MFWPLFFSFVAGVFTGAALRSLPGAPDATHRRRPGEA